MQIIDNKEFCNHLHCLVVFSTYPPYWQMTRGDLRIKIFIMKIDVNEKKKDILASAKKLFTLGKWVSVFFQGYPKKKNNLKLHCSNCSVIPTAGNCCG